MAQITLRVSDEILEKLQSAANAENLTLTDFLLSKTFPTYLNEILTIDKVLEKVSEVPSDTKFSLKSLFPSETWENFTPGSRISTGRLFYQAYKDNKFNLKSLIEFKGKNSANLAFYYKK